MTEPHRLLAMARGVLDRGDPDVPGLWPRASALLGCRSLEVAVQRVWESRTLDLQRVPMRVQLICLRRYLDDADLAARTGHAWAALSRACHHHAYELAPTADELAGWLGVVDELIARTA